MSKPSPFHTQAWLSAEPAAALQRIRRDIELLERATALESANTTVDELVSPLPLLCRLLPDCR